jgi:hypothetical protein
MHCKPVDQKGETIKLSRFLLVNNLGLPTPFQQQSFVQKLKRCTAIFVKRTLVQRISRFLSTWKVPRVLVFFEFTFAFINAARLVKSIIFNLINETM